jgi:Na+/H+ antiporter NhaA
VCVVTVFVAAGVEVSAAGSVLVSTVVGAVVSGVAVGDGVGVASVGWESVVTGCACWAANGVDESARAAAIAGRALVRA